MKAGLFVLCTAVAVFLASAQNPPRSEVAAKSLYKRWLNEDVIYIITGQERQEFVQLQTDEAREQFVEEFWRRRDPTPNTEENEYKEEHYRRIACANARFSTDISGWKTDRGRIYIVLGPPDEIDATHLSERWTYRDLEGMGNNVTMEFVDVAKSGEYHLQGDSSVALTLNEQLGVSTNPDSFTRTDPLPDSVSEFERLEAFAKSRGEWFAYRDLEAIASSKVPYNSLPIKVRTDFIKLTDCTVLTNLTLQFDRQSSVKIFGRISSMTRRPIDTFRDQLTDGASIYQRSIPLPAGLYRLNLVAKDLASGNMTSYEMALNVPQFAEDQLSSSSMILADVIEKGTGQFAIGDTKVRPRVSETFHRKEKLGVYAQLYEFGVDPATRRPNASIEYRIVKAGTDRPLIDSIEDAAALPGFSARQAAIEKWLPLDSLEPGKYTLSLTLADKINRQKITRAVGFAVE